MPVDLYYCLGCSSCRSVMMTAKAIGIDLNLKHTNLSNGDHMRPEFLKMNPQHCVPTMDDNGFVLWESRVILSYLMHKYAKNDSLYPKNPKKRALVDLRLYFDLGTLYRAFSDYYYPVMFAGAEADPAKFTKIEEAFTLLDKFLEGEDWVAGSNVTIADISLVATVSTLEIVGFDISKYPNVTSWLEKAKKTIEDYESINHAGCLEFKEMFDHLTGSKE